MNRGDETLEAVPPLVPPNDDAASVLSRYLPNEPPKALASRFAEARFPVLRAYCLRGALRGKTMELIDLAHTELRAEIEKKNKHSSSRDLQEFQEDGQTSENTLLISKTLHF